MRSYIITENCDWKTSSQISKKLKKNVLCNINKFVIVAVRSDAEWRWKWSRCSAGRCRRLQRKGCCGYSVLRIWTFFYCCCYHYLNKYPYVLVSQRYNAIWCSDFCTAVRVKSSNLQVIFEGFKTSITIQFQR